MNAFASARRRALVLALALDASLLAACGGGGSLEGEGGRRTPPALTDGRGETQPDGVDVDDRRYPFDAAIGEIWGRASPWPTHFNVDFTLTDGRFSVTPIVVDGRDASVREPVGASAVLRAELYAPDVDAFPFADYAFVAAPDVPGAVAGLHFFTAARLGTDDDGSGEVDGDEMRDVIDGRIEFAGPLPTEILLTFSLTLEDGATANGRYGGLFEFLRLAPP